EITDLPQQPVVFTLIQEAGRVAEEEMFRVFNMGVGFAAVVSEEDAEVALATLRDAGAPDARIIGRVKGDEPGKVLIPGRGLVGTRKGGFVRAR
ncbi:MAG: AIR synthase-related protein, partial [Gemmatimonadales bacterium]